MRGRPLLLAPAVEPSRVPSGGAVVLQFARPGTTAPVVVADPVAVVKACGCGHGKQAHEHYRRGTDCASCSCSRYARPLLRRLSPRRG